MTIESDFDRGHAAGVTAGEIAERLREHDEHFERINGSLGDMVDELHQMTLAIQRLGDEAEASAQNRYRHGRGVGEGRRSPTRQVGDGMVAGRQGHRNHRIPDHRRWLPDPDPEMRQSR